MIIVFRFLPSRRLFRPIDCSVIDRVALHSLEFELSYILIIMSPIRRRCPSWQTLCLLLSFYLSLAVAGPVLEAKGLPEPIVPPKPKVNEPEFSNPWSSSTWKGGTSGASSEPMGYIPASAVAPADDVNKPLFSNTGTFHCPAFDAIV